MGRWSELRKIADENFWYPQSLNYEGPACYELVIAGTRKGNAKIVYVGETKNEKCRITSHARRSSHLSEIIEWHLAQGWHLYYRSQALPTKEMAFQMQNRLLSKRYYPWNTVGA